MIVNDILDLTVALIISKIKRKYLSITLLAVIATSLLIIIRNETLAQPSVTPALEVGTSPVEIAVNPKTNMVYVVNQDSNSVSVINGSTNSVVAHITIVTNMGEEQEDTLPTAVAVNPDMNMVYVADSWNDIISVINGSTNSVVAHIKVGTSPVEIAVNPKTNMVYVANRLDETVSVINGSTNSVVDEWKVGSNPNDIAVNPKTNMVYVANRLDETVSVINGSTNSVVADDILVGRNPVSVNVNPNTNLIYVANWFDDTVSVIDGSTNSVIYGVTYNINPPDSGVVYCNGQKISNNDHKRYDIDTQIKCEAKANSVFPPGAFSSWSVFPPITFDSWSGDLKSSDSANVNNQNPNPTFEVSQYGILTFNFKEFIPSEYLTKKVGIPIILGLILPSIVAWLFTKRRRRYLGRYMKAIDTAYHTSNQNKEECSMRLNEIRRQITELFGRGKISESHYEILNEKISEYIKEINK